MDERICSVDGCAFPHAAKGYCDRHYASFRRYGDPLEAKSRRFNCSVAGCPRRHYGLGLCQLHHRRSKLGIAADMPVKRPTERFPNGDTTCNTCLQRKARAEFPASGRANCKDCLRRAARERYYATRDERIKSVRRWQQENAERVNELRREWIKKNPERYAVRRRAALARRTLAIKAGLGVTISAESLAGKALLYGGKCWICRRVATQWDHVKPLGAGGPHMLANLRPSCARCNQRKNSRWPLTSEQLSKIAT